VTGFIGRGTRWLVRHTAGDDAVRSFLVNTAALFNIDLVLTAYKSIGILNYEDSRVSGEDHLIREILPRIVRTEKPVLFDVGANRGEMSVALRKSFPAARILAFEPNPITYKALIETAKDVECVESGLGAEPGKGLLHCYTSDQMSGHASMYRDVFRFYEGYGINAAADLTTFEFDIDTVDNVCRTRGIEAIDFMKIDVEGHELSVLKGAAEMLARIALIQFEFNEGNVLSRTFMRDFYELLRDFAFFRLAPDRLIPMGPYASRHEIFQFQNVLAVRTGSPQWEALR